MAKVTRVFIVTGQFKEGSDMSAAAIAACIEKGMAPGKFEAARITVKEAK